MNILLDACVILAVLLEEPEKDMVLESTKKSILVVPNVIDFEIGNALSKLYKRNIITEKDVHEAFLAYRQIPLNVKTVDMYNSMRIFCTYSIYAYDAYYLELASRLNISLMTFDSNMKAVAKKMKINILEV